MKILALEQPPGVPYLALKLLNVIGIAGESHHRYRIWLTMATFVLVIAIPKIFFGYPTFEMVIIGLAELIFEFNSFLGLLLVFLHNKQMTTLAGKARTFSRNALNESPAIVQRLSNEHRRIHEVSKLYCLTVLCAVLVFSFSPFCFTLVTFIGTLKDANATMHYTLHMEENFYGLAVKTSFLHYVIYGLFLFPTSYLCAYVSTAKAVPICSFIRCCTNYFELVQLKIHDVALNDTFDRDIKTVVKMHDEVLSFAKCLEIALSEVLLLQFIMCVLIWSSMLLFFTVSGVNPQFVNLLVLFVVNATETFGYCYLGDQLSDESVRVAQTVYASSNWETQCPAVQKDLQLILLRAQKPVAITAGKFCSMDIERFGKLVKTAYSVFIVLKDQI